MKTKLFLLLIFFTIKTYAQNNQVTVNINNSAICKNQNFSGMVMQNSQYALQPSTFNMWLGYLNSNQQNAVYRGYQEFKLNTKESIPPDITNTNITKAILIGELSTSTQSNSTVNIFRHDKSFPCSMADAVRWKYLEGDVQSRGIRTQIGAFNFGNNHKIEELNILEHVKLKRQNDTLILGYRNASETTQNLWVDIRLEVTYNQPPAPATAPNLSCNFKTQKSCTLSLTAPSGPLLGYDLYMMGNPNPVRKIDAPATSVDISGLQEATTYYFYARAYNSGGYSPYSTVLEVTTPSISGNNTVCYEGSNFTLENYLHGTVQWTLTGPFTLNSATANPVTVIRTGSGTGSGTLTAKIADKVVAAKTITPCAYPTISGPTSVCYEGSTFTLDPVPQGTITWTVTGPFSVSGNGATATVIRTGSSNTNGILKVAVNGVGVVSKSITPCAPPTIAGPDYITNYMSGSYSVDTTYPAHWSVTPTTAPGFQITSGQNTNNAYVKALYNTPTSGSPNGALTATITLPDNSVITVSKTIKGVLPVTSILKPASPIVVNLLNSSGTTVSFYANPATSIYYDDYEWSIIPNVTSKHNFGSMLNVTFHSGGTYCINCRIASSYYTQPHPVQICFTVHESWGYAAYPNPASNILNIEIDAEAIAQAKALEQTTTSARQLKSDPTYDVRLYDGQGNLLRNAKTKGGKIEFNVSNLSTGIYYLHIYDGVNEKPKIQQIVVER